MFSPLFIPTLLRVAYRVCIDRPVGMSLAQYPHLRHQCVNVSGLRTNHCFIFKPYDRFEVKKITNRLFYFFTWQSFVNYRVGIVFEGDKLFRLGKEEQKK